MKVKSEMAGPISLVPPSRDKPSSDRRSALLEKKGRKLSLSARSLNCFHRVEQYDEGVYGRRVMDDATERTIGSDAIDAVEPSRGARTPQSPNDCALAQRDSLGTETTASEEQPDEDKRTSLICKVKRRSTRRLLVDFEDDSLKPTIPTRPREKSPSKETLKPSSQKKLSSQQESPKRCRKKQSEPNGIYHGETTGNKEDKRSCLPAVKRLSARHISCRTDDAIIPVDPTKEPFDRSPRISKKAEKYLLVNDDDDTSFFPGQNNEIQEVDDLFAGMTRMDQSRNYVSEPFDNLSGFNSRSSIDLLETPTSVEVSRRSTLGRSVSTTALEPRKSSLKTNLLYSHLSKPDDPNQVEEQNILFANWNLLHGINPQDDPALPLSTNNEKHKLTKPRDASGVNPCDGPSTPNKNQKQKIPTVRNTTAVNVDVRSKLGRSASTSALQPKKSSMKKKDHTPTSKRNMQRSTSVKFDKIQVREYERTLGDNPAVSAGPPVSLGWQYAPEQELDVERYESHRPPRRSKHEFAIPANVREKMLVGEWGHTMLELRLASFVSNRIKVQRMETAAQNLDVQNMEEMLESSKERLSTVPIAAKQGKKGKELWEKRHKR